MKPQFGDAERSNAELLAAAALEEDLRGHTDLTTSTLIEASAQGRVHIVGRRAGTIAGLPIVPLTLARLAGHVEIEWHTEDGAQAPAGARLATLSGSTTTLLIAERTILNFLTHLSGVATFTRMFVDRIAGSRARIFDTRKTLPGWRALERYAVRCGGGSNHRFGLFDAVLIKDNHLAAWSGRSGTQSLAEAVRMTRARAPQGVTIEIEVESLDQLRAVLPAQPDIVLLDNMDPPVLREAVRLRDRTDARVQLEASGGVTLDTVGAMAATGVDRISVGALTHSAPALDLAFDWDGPGSGRPLFEAQPPR